MTGADIHPPTATAREPEVLLRLRIDGGDWSEHLPPVPAGHDVSVSFTSAVSSRNHGDALAELGYRVVGVVGAPNGGEFADLVLREGTAEECPSWWRAVAALAERAYPLALGPAARACAPVVERHGAHGHGGRGDDGRPGR